MMSKTNVRFVVRMIRFVRNAAPSTQKTLSSLGSDAESTAFSFLGAPFLASAIGSGSLKTVTLPGATDIELDRPKSKKTEEIAVNSAA